MKTIFRCALLGLVVALAAGVTSPARSADKGDKGKAKPKTTTTSDDPDPEGRWSGYKVGQTRRYHVWHDTAGWHVRMTSGKKVTFNGTVTVAGGKFVKLFGFENLEFGNDAKKSDIGRINADRTRIDFRFVTNGGEDPFDFTVSDKATEVTFTLRIENSDLPETIFIGKQGQHPKEVTFTFPAHPDRKKD